MDCTIVRKNVYNSPLNVKLKGMDLKVKITNIRQTYARFVRQSKSPVLYNETLKDGGPHTVIKNVLEVQYDKDVINIIVNKFTSILTYAGMKVLTLKRHKVKEALNQKMKYQWFDCECYTLRKGYLESLVEK